MFVKHEDNVVNLANVYFFSTYYKGHEYASPYGIEFDTLDGKEVDFEYKTKELMDEAFSKIMLALRARSPVVEV